MKKQKKDEYDLILDNQVDFVQTQILDGILSEIKTKKKKTKDSSSSSSDSEVEISEAALKEAEAKLTPLEKKRLDIQFQRESLPMYPLRNDLLAAIRDN